MIWSLLPLFGLQVFFVVGSASMSVGPLDGLREKFRIVSDLGLIGAAVLIAVSFAVNGVAVGLTSLLIAVAFVLAMISMEPKLRYLFKADLSPLV